MVTYFKALTMTGASFAKSHFLWDVTPGGVTTHPSGVFKSPRPADYLSVSDDPLVLPGAGWPLRLFEVAPVGRTWKAAGPLGKHEHKRCGLAFKMVRELPAHLTLGPDGPLFLQVLDEWFTTHALRVLAPLAHSGDLGRAASRLREVAYSSSSGKHILPRAEEALDVALRAFHFSTTEEGRAALWAKRTALCALAARPACPDSPEYALISGMWLYLTGRLLHPHDPRDIPPKVESYATTKVVTIATLQGKD